MKVVGITGPTGAGKTTALAALRSLGAEVADADAVYHRLLAESGELKAAMIQAFGEDILDEEGKIDRKRLARTVYPHRLEELNALTHPYVLEEIDALISRARGAGKPIFAIDAIALFESGLALRCDETVAVLAPPELRLRRIMARDGIDEGYARRRMKAQKPDSFYRERCGLVLENRAEDAPGDFEGRARALFSQKFSKP